MCNIIICLTCLFAFRSRVYIRRREKKRDYVCLAVASMKVFKNYLSRRQSVVVYVLQIFLPPITISTTKLHVFRPPVFLCSCCRNQKAQDYVFIDVCNLYILWLRLYPPLARNKSLIYISDITTRVGRQ